MKIIIVAVLITLLLTSETVFGVPANPEPFNLTQPDNSSFQARQVGDERAAHFETLEGYTIVQDETKWWNYAKKDEKGKISSTGKKVGLVKSEKLDLSKHLHPSVTEDIFSKEPMVSVLVSQVGTKKAIVILINFTNVSQDVGHTSAYYENLLFNTSTSANSMHNYYKEVSYNQINITGNIAGNRWYGSAHNQSFYGKDLDHTSGSHDNYYGAIFRLAREALILADSDINFATYDTNSDGVLNRDEINIIIVHAGCGEENTGCQGWSTDSIWSHKWDILGSPYGCSDCIDTFLDGKRISRNNSNEDIAGYTMLSEFSPLGTFAHEYGHDLGVPDLYDTDYTSNGVGDWDTMASGSWLNNGNTPSHLSAWSKYFLGWINPTKVTTSLLNEQINQSETNDDVYMLLDNPGDSPGNLDWTSSGTGTGEYFLVENRRYSGYDFYLPGSGLLIWHIDESKGDNKNESHKLVDLEEADGLNHLDSKINYGDSNDPWYSSITGFTNIFNPNSKLYNGSASNVSVTNISASGYTMTANFIVSSSDWQYNRKLTITGSAAGPQSNYQMKLTIYKGNGTDSPGVVYLGGSVKDDFSDLRFTKSDGVTLLDYWIESYTSGVSAVVWVEVDYIPDSDTTDIYLYYGNPSAAGAGSGAATFPLFDDFDDGTYSGWTAVDGTWSAGQGFLRSGTSGLQEIKIPSSTAYGAWEWDFRTNGMSNSEMFFKIMSAGNGISNNQYAHRVNPVEARYFEIRRDVGGLSYPVDSSWTRDTNWHKIKITRSQTGTFELFLDGTSKGTGTDNNITSTSMLAIFTEGVQNYDFDNIRIRKFVSPEPAWSA